MATIFDVANYFRWRVDYEAGDNITALKLQKLCYYAQAWHLAFTGNALFEEEFQACDHGPLNRDLWKHYQQPQGWIPIEPDNALWEFEPASVFTSDELETLNEVWDTYGTYGANHLEHLTHQEDPWRLAPKNSVIAKSVIQNYYFGQLEREHGKQNTPL